jgi:hypothetical protein
MNALVVVQSQSDLLEVIDALCPASRLSGCLNRRQQQGDEHPDDRDGHKQLDQREGIKALRYAAMPHGCAPAFSQYP